MLARPPRLRNQSIGTHGDALMRPHDSKLPTIQEGGSEGLMRARHTIVHRTSSNVLGSEALQRVYWPHMEDAPAQTQLDTGNLASLHNVNIMSHVAGARITHPSS